VCRSLVLELLLLLLLLDEELLLLVRLLRRLEGIESKWSGGRAIEARCALNEGDDDTDDPWWFPIFTLVENCIRDNY